MNATPFIHTDADERIEIAGPQGMASAQLWWTQTPPWPEGQLGAIGSFRANTAAATAELLVRATEILCRNGCAVAVGPMDGNTWRDYRFVTEAGGEPPFVFEPANPPEWPQWWIEAGFAPLARYYSTVVPDLLARDERLDEAELRLRRAGVSWRPLERADFAAELDRIYDVSVVSFRSNFLYSPLQREKFAAQYRPIQDRIVPELVWLAEHEGRAVGYAFTVPDFLQAKRGAMMDTLIVKTLAVLPGRAYAGLGAVLLGAAQAAAAKLGFKRAIHALMHESNVSRNLSAHYAVPIRRYALLARRLMAT